MPGWLVGGWSVSAFRCPATPPPRNRSSSVVPGIREHVGLVFRLRQFPAFALNSLKKFSTTISSQPCYSAKRRAHQEGPLVVSDGCRRRCLIPFRGLGYPVTHDVGNVQFVVFDTPHLHASSEHHGEPGSQFGSADRVSSS